MVRRSVKSSLYVPGMVSKKDDTSPTLVNTKETKFVDEIAYAKLYIHRLTSCALVDNVAMNDVGLPKSCVLLECFVYVE